MLQLVEFNFMPANNSRKQPEQFTIIVNSINEIEKIENDVKEFFHRIVTTKTKRKKIVLEYMIDDLRLFLKSKGWKSPTVLQSYVADINGIVNIEESCYENSEGEVAVTELEQLIQQGLENA
jgi:cellulose biosynthesis protein BcsQ